MARTAELAFIVSVKSELDRLQRDLDRTQKSLNKVGGGFNNTKKVAASLERGLLLVGGAAVAGTAVASKMAMEFESSMQKIVGLVGVSQQQVDTWSKQLLTLAPALGKSPAELADALYYVTSAGIKTSDAIGVLTASARASTAGLGTTSDIANAVTSAINAYGIKALSASKATDILTAAVKFGKVEAGELAPVMGQVVPMASALGVSFDQVAGIMAVMSRTGMDASESAVSLNAAFTGLLKPTKQGRDELEQHHLSMAKLRDMIKKPGGVLEVFRLLDTTFGNDKEALAKVIPNVRSMRGLMNVLAQDSGVVDEVMQGVTKSTGSADKAFESAAQTAKYKYDAALAQVQASSIEFGAVALPLVTSAMGTATRALSDMTAAWNALTPEQQKSRVESILWVAGTVAVGYAAIKAVQGGSALVKVYKELAASATLAGEASVFAQAGMVGLAGGVGFATGMLINMIPAVQDVDNWLGDLITDLKDAKGYTADANDEWGTSAAVQETMSRMYTDTSGALTEYGRKLIYASSQLRKSTNGANDAASAQLDYLNSLKAVGNYLSPLRQQELIALQDRVNARAAQRSYNATVKQYGENSAEAQAALIRLREAQNKARFSGSKLVETFGKMSAKQIHAANDAGILTDKQEKAALAARTHERALAGKLTPAQIDAAAKAGILSEKEEKAARAATEARKHVDKLSTSLAAVPHSVETNVTVDVHRGEYDSFMANLMSFRQSEAKYANSHPGAKHVDVGVDVHKGPERALGGLTYGPTSGYPVTLHGIEAVLPLNNPRRYEQVLAESDAKMGIRRGGNVTHVTNNYYATVSGTDLSEARVGHALKSALFAKAPSLQGAH